MALSEHESVQSAFQEAVTLSALKSISCKSRSITATRTLRDALKPSPCLDTIPSKFLTTLPLSRLRAGQPEAAAATLRAPEEEAVVEALSRPLRNLFLLATFSASLSARAGRALLTAKLLAALAALQPHQRLLLPLLSSSLPLAGEAVRPMAAQLSAARKAL